MGIGGGDMRLRTPATKADTLLPDDRLGQCRRLRCTGRPSSLSSKVFPAKESLQAAETMLVRCSSAPQRNPGCKELVGATSLRR